MSDLRNTLYFNYTVDNMTYPDDLIYVVKSVLDSVVDNGQLNTYSPTGSQVCTLPSLSMTFYGTTDWWWLLGVINGIDNIFQPIDSTIVFYYPSVLQLSAYQSLLVSLLTVAKNQAYSGTSSEKNNSSLSNKYIGGILVF